MTSLARCIAALGLCACSGAGRSAPQSNTAVPASTPPAAAAEQPVTSASASPSAVPAAAVTPNSGGRYTLAAAPRKLEISADTGARITEFSIDGQNVFATPSDDAYSYGVTFWPSPQKAWNWPPPEEIDIGPYTGAQNADVVTLSSAPSPRVGLSADKAIRLDAATGSVHITYTLHNLKDTPLEVAPWENARVRGGGITFFPIDGKPAAQSTLTFAVRNGIASYANATDRAATNEKGFADGKEGWLAHSDHRLLWIVEFDDVPRGAQAPGESEIELYVDGKNRFVEVEHQGRYAAIPPHQSTTWSVTWHLERLPDDLTASNVAALAAFVRRTLKRR